MSLFKKKKKASLHIGSGGVRDLFTTCFAGWKQHPGRQQPSVAELSAAETDSLFFKSLSEFFDWSQYTVAETCQAIGSKHDSGTRGLL